MSEANPTPAPNQAETPPPTRQDYGRIFCPVCRSEILPGEPVCWVCYGGQHQPQQKGFSAGTLVGSILGGVAISIGSVLIGVVITFIAIMAAFESFLESLGCATFLATFALMGWGMTRYFF